MEIRAAENFCDPREGDRELRQRSRGDRGRPGPLGWRWYRRVYGLDNVQAGEMVEFENGVRGICRCQSQIGDAAQALQRDGLIDYRRGTMQILNRRGLEEASCECYAAIKESFNDSLIPFPHAVFETTYGRQ
jgi:hypothetical protein